MDREKTINKLKQIKKFAIKNDMPGLEKTAKSAIKLLKEKKPAQIKLEGEENAWRTEIMKKNKLAHGWTDMLTGERKSD